ncbi:unnamed protein product [Rotaria magnacalcarata]|uniref:Uncharacterized protein n=1 Tax=Rotaria magnacalcarata TaxID=392030 RepID=A0A816NPG9_9BILA|nr:unnamed protein product [Rotaria magnacalcarata]CAF3876233.1 unnamed protein product [Rotaria magnacalcarata]
MTSFPLNLPVTQKDTLDDITDEIKQFDWELGEYLFHDFIEYFQLPQIIRISQPWDTNLVKNDIFHLQAMYDRHLIVSKSLVPDNRTYIVPDWFQGQCRILTAAPIYKPRWWEFRNALELLRFKMPRDHIRVLQDTHTLLLLPTNQTIPVLIKQNTEVTLKRIEKSKTITDGKEMFVLVDKNDQEFLLDPTDSANTFHFATQILDNEFDKSYHKHTKENLFTLPEILIRYELPIDIEIVTLVDTIPIESFPSKLRLEKYSIVKSIAAISIGDPNHPRILEFSSLTQFSLNCVKCLTAGLPRDSSVHEENRTFDESAYHQYESVRERLVQLFEDISIQYMRTPFIGNPDEVESIEKVFDIGLKLKTEEQDQTYIVLEQSNSTSNQSNSTSNQSNNTSNQSTNATPSINKQPARFTVHLPADFNSPYSNVMELGEDEDDQEMSPSTNA